MKNKKLVLVFALVAVLVASVMICPFIAFAEDNDVTVAKLGDVDGNGTVGAEDVVLLRQYFANYDYDTNTSYTQITTGADLNNDGKVTLVDLQKLRVGIANGDFDEPEGCAHEWADATCETPKTCSICGETEGEALGHNTNGTVEHKDATCTENGVVGGTYCDVCNEGKEAAEKVIEAAGHDWAAATCTTAKTCQREGCGIIEGTELGHTWVDATYTTPKNCSVCGTTEGYPKGFTKYLDATAVSDALKKGTHSGGTVVSGDKSYVTVSLDVANNKVESYFNLFSGNTEVTGQYLIIKYRTSSAAGYMEIYASTEVEGTSNAQNLGGYFAPNSGKGLYLKDGEWHVIAIDLSEAMQDTAFAANGEGKYVAKFVRLDLFNVSKSNTEECSIDIAFIGMCENYEDVISYSNTTLFYDTELKTVCDHDWKIVDVNGGKICNLCGLVDKRAVFFNIDGLGDKAGGRYSDVVVLAEGHPKYPEGGFTTDATTLGKLYFSGWIGTYEDISSLVFRVTDESGEVSDWITFEKNGSTAIVRETTDTTIGNIITNNLSAEAHRHRIGGWMDLNDYSGQTVKVEIAIVLKDVPAEQQYFTIITAENVRVG